MLEGMNYLHAKFKINIFRHKKVIKLLELRTLWKKEKKREKNSEYNRVVITTLKKGWTPILQPLIETSSPQQTQTGAPFTLPPPHFS